VGLDLGGVVEILVMPEVGERFGMFFELYYDIRKRLERRGEKEMYVRIGKAFEISPAPFSTL
jgi:hypothetical protein